MTNEPETPEDSDDVHGALRPSMLELREKLATAERERDEAIKAAAKGRAYKSVLKNENARLRRMLNLPANVESIRAEK